MEFLHILLDANVVFDRNGLIVAFRGNDDISNILFVLRIKYIIIKRRREREREKGRGITLRFYILSL